MVLTVQAAEVAARTGDGEALGARMQVADWFVWLASTLGRFFDERSGKAERNANEFRRADHEVHDIADGRYDGRIQKFQQEMSR